MEWGGRGGGADLVGVNARCLKVCTNSILSELAEHKGNGLLFLGSLFPPKDGSYYSKVEGLGGSYPLTSTMTTAF